MTRFSNAGAESAEIGSNFSNERPTARVVTTPPPAPGFAGPGHWAVEVLPPRGLTDSDPFVLLMDDRLDFEAGRQIGAAHPHAGLETVTLVLEGSVRDRDEGRLSAGDAVWMTAGRGIIHNEDVEALGKVRVLQLWIGLPSASRSAAPAFERIPFESVPVRRENGVEARVYSGSSGAVVSRTRNLVPVTLLDVHLQPGATFTQELPATYNGFAYVLDGTVEAGANAARLSAGQVGWLGPAPESGTSRWRVSAGPAGARFVLYAGERHGETVIQHGPFVAGSEREIAKAFQDYQTRKFVRLSDLSRAERAGMAPARGEFAGN